MPQLVEKCTSPSLGIPATSVLWVTPHRHPPYDRQVLQEGNPPVCP